MIFNLMKPIPIAEPTEPTATMYSYNGTVLPALPEWDKTAYPYAVITEFTVLNRTKFTLTLYKSLFTALDENFNDSWSLLAYGDYLTAYIYPSSSTEWSEFETHEPATIIGTVFIDGVKTPYTSRLTDYDSDYIFWSNHSFYGPNGEEWITASDPVPVYE